MYATGDGVTKDQKQSFYWSQKAAEQGNVIAQYHLGAMYADGNGVIKDDVQAHKWWNIAAASGKEDAKKNREIIENRMTSEQIAKANKQARKWMEIDRIIKEGIKNFDK